MAVNDIFMLPERKRSMRELADLLGAEQQELELFNQLVADTENQLHINTSTAALSRYEAQFASPVATGLSVQERRIRIIAKLNTRSPTTVQAMIKLAELITGCPSSIVEDFASYAFSVMVDLVEPENTKSIRALIQQIQEIKPAHLMMTLIALSHPVIEVATQMYTAANVRFIYSPRKTNDLLLLDGSWYLDGYYGLSGIKTNQRDDYYPLELAVATLMLVQPVIYPGVIMVHEVVSLARMTAAVDACSNVASQGHVEMADQVSFKMSSPIGINRIHVTVEKNLWYLDGSVLLDGSVELNADRYEMEV